MTKSAEGRTIVLASASPARLRLLRDAGFAPVVQVSGIDESLVPADDPWEMVRELATRKARAVADSGQAAGALVVGCDSTLLFGGRALGKPCDADEATRRWHELRGGTGVLLTGHCVIDVDHGRQVSDVADTVVRFGAPTDDEIAAYVETGEPLHVAGAFTLDGRSSVFIDGIDGDAGNVIGLSLPLLRRLLAELGVAVTSLWCSTPETAES
jgi:septum formation protein